MASEIEQKLSNINDNLIHLSEQMSDAETKVFIPQLENTNVILKSLRNKETQNVILQNDKCRTVIKKPRRSPAGVLDIVVWLAGDYCTRARQCGNSVASPVV